MNNNIILDIQERGDFVTLPNGSVYFWPTKNDGAYSSDDLKIIANEIDRRNKHVNKERKQYKLFLGEEHGY